MAALLVAALLAVAIHNSAEVPEATLNAAKVEVTRIFDDAHVTVAWVHVIQPSTFGIQ
jgi:hypothetical protein